ncbi:MAG TPA: BMP family protein [Phycisphaerae bacterium]|nr:BMP family protein [Phycisphaerae bacterium]
MWKVLGVAVAAALLAACSDNSSTPATGTAPAGATMKVGLMVSGSTSDGGWNQLGQSSLDALSKRDSLDVRTRQNVSKDSAADALRQFDAQGFALVIAHGYEYLEPVKELTDPAKGNAVKEKVVVSGGDVDSPNFQSLAYDLSGASYQLGIVAAKVTKSHKLGFIGGEAIPTVTAMKRGFEAGAKSVDPTITVTTQYTGWDDPAKSKTQAEAFMDAGIDVIMQNTDAASSGIFEAVKEFNDKNGFMKEIPQKNPPAVGIIMPRHVYTFGANADQNGNAICSDYILGSAVIHMDKAFSRVIEEVRDGTFKGGLVKEDLANGVCEAVLNPKLTGTVLKDVQPLLDDAVKKITSGEVKIPAGD